MDMQSPEGSRALVTGASRGVGRAVALALKAAGMAVTGTARASADLDGLAAEGMDVWAEDATSDALLARIRDAAPFHLLVNNAGVARHAPLADTPDADIDAVLALNLRATLRITREAVRRMERGASVVTVTSQMAHVGGPDRVVYCATKAALEGMSRALAVELAPRGIRSNCVAPTFVATAMTAATLGDPDKREWVESNIPLGRVAMPGEIARAVLYLAGADMVTGTSLLVDGGWTAR